MVLLKNYFVKFSTLAAFVALISSNTFAKETRPKYKVQKIQISNTQIKIELAESEIEHEYGLMFVTKLEKNSGMLFVFQDEQVRNFWMKNTLIPLSIGFFDKNKTLVSTQEMVPYIDGTGAPAIYPSLRPAKYALEMNKNWFNQNKIKIGDKFQFIK